MFLVTLFGMAFFIIVLSFVNSIGIKFAADISEAECSEYKTVFKIIATGYLLVVLGSFILTGLGMLNTFFVIILLLGVISWALYQLVKQLGIKGNKNIIIFVCFSFVFNVVINAVFFWK